MQLSVIGALIGAAVGMFAVSLIMRIFLPTDIDTKREKWIRGIACVLVMAIFIFLGGYLFRTRLNMGDYSQEQCYRAGCSHPPVCHLRYELSNAYYCEEHMVDAYELIDP